MMTVAVCAAFPAFGGTTIGAGYAAAAMMIVLPGRPQAAAARGRGRGHAAALPGSWLRAAGGAGLLRRATGPPAAGAMCPFG